jgi:hypothetical protein
MRYRVEMAPHSSQRVALTAPRRIEQLASRAKIGIKRDRPLRRRANMAAKLQRSLVVARQHALDEHDEMLK